MADKLQIAAFLANAIELVVIQFNIESSIISKKKTR